MQHRYVPDLGDYSKFALLDALAEPEASGSVDPLRVGLVWYLANPDTLGERDNGDGRHTDYLTLTGQARDRFRDGCPKVYDKLVRIHQQLPGAKLGEVGLYAQHGLLPNSPAGPPVWFEDEVTPPSGTDPVAHRQDWAQRSAQAVEACALVMLDPDNGLANPSVKPSQPRFGKYAALEECRRFFDWGQRSLVVYQHATRRGTITAQARQAVDRLAGALGLEPGGVMALRFHRGSSRLYLIAPAQPHRDRLTSGIEALLQGPMGRFGHFSRAG